LSLLPCPADSAIPALAQSRAVGSTPSIHTSGDGITRQWAGEARDRAASPNLEPRQYAQRGRDSCQRPGDGGLDITWGFNENEPRSDPVARHDPNAARAEPDSQSSTTASATSAVVRNASLPREGGRHKLRRAHLKDTEITNQSAYLSRWQHSFRPSAP
jgi:hypothetical protein